MITGIFFIAAGVSFPAIKIKNLTPEKVVVQVFTDTGMFLREATIADSGDAEGTFIED